MILRKYEHSHSTSAFSLMPLLPLSPRPRLTARVLTIPVLCVVALLGALFAFVTVVSAQAPGDTISLVHGTDSVRLKQRTAWGGRREVDVTGEEVRLWSPREAAVVARGAVSAYYTCTLAEKPLAVPELMAIRDFLSSSGAFLTEGALADLAATILRRPAPGGIAVLPPVTIAKLLISSVARADTLVLNYVRPARAEAQVALDAMRLPKADVSGIAAGFRNTLATDTFWQTLITCDGTTCKDAKIGQTLATHILEAQRRAAELRQRLTIPAGQPGAVPAAERPEYEELLKLLTPKLEKTEDIVALGYDTDAVLLATANATADTPCGTTRVGLWEGKTATATVAPRPSSLLARHASAKYERTLSVLPDWIVRPALGLSLYYTEDAEFPKYGATTAPNSMKRIFVSGTQDARVLYGVTLGLTYRYVDARTGRVPVAFWLPEVFVNPLEQNRALGIGAGLSVSVFKLGYGYGWVKHQALDGQQLDDLLLDANLLKTRDVYGRPLPYWSFSVTGWPPFLKAK